MAICFGHAFGTQHEHAASSIVPGGPARLLNHSTQEVLRLVHVLGRMFVQDHDISLETLEAPVLLRMQELSDERNRGDVGDTNEHYREIAGNTEAPQVGLAKSIAGEILWAETRLI